MTTKDKIQLSLSTLNKNFRKSIKPLNMSFEDFLYRVSDNPFKSFRNIYQLFYDMVHHYVPDGLNEYENDPESINYINYDTSKLFSENSNNPFFADRLLANHLINVVDSMRFGAMKNKMLTFVGPPGSGKSTFLDNLLKKLEVYTASEDGVMFETVWIIDREKLGSYTIDPRLTDKNLKITDSGVFRKELSEERFIKVPCPCHDHPILQIPKNFRKQLLSGVIKSREKIKTLLTAKEYDWVFGDESCQVCSSIYKALSEKISAEEILSMIHIRKYEFTRKLGEGISVYNPGDLVSEEPLGNAELQKWLDAVFKSSNAVNYIYSELAQTNNGVYAIMDVKLNNIERLKNIHGIISDGIHKVATFEEHINSIFMTLINPEDSKVIDEEKSFQDRVTKIPIPYVRDYATEVAIYRNIYGKDIDEKFLPQVIFSFAKAIVASRLDPNSKAVHEWIKDFSMYKKICDKNLFLLQMGIYKGEIPVWLSEEDVKRLDRNMRLKIINEGEGQGRTGISGRESVHMFNLFLSQHKKQSKFISIENIVDFLKSKKYLDKIPEGFVDALHNNYNYTLLQEIKECMFYYNKEQIANEIKDYMFAINNEMGSEVESPFTKVNLFLSEDYFKIIECRFIKSTSRDKERIDFRNRNQKLYVSKTLHEIKQGKDITKTAQYKDLLERYNRNLKENVLVPFSSNENFRRAIKDYKTQAFKNYDNKIRNEVNYLMQNLITKFNYTQEGAKQVCIYTLDQKIFDKF